MEKNLNPLHVKGSSFIKAITEFKEQGEDITTINQSGVEPIYHMNLVNKNIKI